MSKTLQFALNHITTPQLSSRAFLDLAARLGCNGVELRNDLADKQLTDRAFFDGEEPAAIGVYARRNGNRLLGLSEVYGFNRWSETMRSATAKLIGQAKAAGAETISLIPSNDGEVMSDDVRSRQLRHALQNILRMLEDADLSALVEPLGFKTSSLRYKGEAVEAIAAIGGEHRFKLVHDTFHHFLADDQEYFPEQTGIVHISGVTDPAVAPSEMRDEHRILVNAEDRLRNVDQIKNLRSKGYAGHFSFECFAPSVHNIKDHGASIAESISFIRAAI